MSQKAPFLVETLPIGRTADGRDIFPDRTFVDAINELIRRTGGPVVDQVAAVATTAQTAAATAAGLAQTVNTTTPPPSGNSTSGFALVPFDPLLAVYVTATTASIQVEAHTRSEGGGAPVSINAGSVPGTFAVEQSYAVYYDDPSGLGGTVTFAATLSASALVAAGRKLVGWIYIPSGDLS